MDRLGPMGVKPEGDNEANSYRVDSSAAMFHFKRAPRPKNTKP